MGKTINDWLSRPVYIYSFGLFFLIYKSSQYFPSFDLLLFICFFVGYCLINCGIILIQKKAGFYKFGSCWLIFTWILFLFSEQIINYLNEYIDPAFVRFRYLFLVIISICLVIYLICRKVDRQKILILNSIINVFVFILTVLTITSGVKLVYWERNHNIALNNRRLPSLDIKNNNDVIWILLDEYTDPASLKSQFKYHDFLVDSLEMKGFFVFDKLKSQSSTTVYSISSLFNLNDTIPIANYSYATHYLDENIWINHLHRIGYDFVNLDFLNIGGYPKFSYLRIFSDNYFDQIISGSVFASLLDNLTEEKNVIDIYNQKVIRVFKQKVNEKRNKPVFIWTHLMIPHEPFYRDANGNMNKSPVLNVSTSPASLIIKQYTEYLSYGNNVLLKMLNEIPNWKNKTIIISGDHGARMLIPDNDPRRKQTFGAIYYPGMDKKELGKIEYMQQIPFHLH